VKYRLALDISILAKSSIAILALVVLLVFWGGISQTSQQLIDLGKTLFLWVLIALVVITLIINAPRFRFLK
jgi:uncharacterized membrane protein YhaH (DUF805 family)